MSKIIELPIYSRITSILADLSWEKALEVLWKIGNKIFKKASLEGMYEVIDYESILEIKDKRGENASLHKTEKVRYLQDNIIAFQDQAWGDGKILKNYRCVPGFPVDQYRSGYKTHILISLRAMKKKGEIDNFKIEWNIEKGFLAKTGFWATEISHHTKRLTTKVIFPKTRPPLCASILERNRQVTHVLEENAKVRLPDGRWMICWKKSQPNLYEQYILNWEW